MSVKPTPVERKQRKRFSAQQKPEILREWEATGNGVKVAERHGIHAGDASGPGSGRTE